ncbi:MAG: flagellar hook assembly protein FlgD [Azoarcus sp.]|jgi:flagellar basal-body rod modification protein FlgD|nr:flagellar hook assembly protein FlgD [Azoarcus sp.]
MSTYDSVAVTQKAADVYAGLSRDEPVSQSTESEQSRFLTLLTTQLRNQDPMNPLENAELTSQLAQMSTVDGIERLNTLVNSLVSSQEFADSAALVGRGVLVEGKGLGLTEAGAIGGFELDAAADKVTLTVRDANGVAVTTIEFADMEAGSHNYIWDGLAADGAQAAQGMYTVTIEASQDGGAVTARTLEFGQVTSVLRNAGGTDLQVGSLGIFTIDDIKQIL